MLIFEGIFPSFCDMAPFTRPTLIALLRGIRFIKHALKSFIVRCLFFWPYILRDLKDAWSQCSHAGSRNSDGRKRNGELGGGPPSSQTSLNLKRIRYDVISASRVPEKASEPNPGYPLQRSGSAEESHPLQHANASLPAVSQPHRSHSPTSTFASSLPGSPQRSGSPLPVDGTRDSTSPYRSESPRGIKVQLTVHRSNTPLAWSHSRATSRQFTGTPSLSRPPSVSLSPFRPYTSSRPSTPAIVIGLNESRPSVIRNSQDDIPASPSPDILVQPPSRSETMTLSQGTHSPPYPQPVFLHGSTSSLSPMPLSPAMSNNLSLDPRTENNSLDGLNESARHSSASITSGYLAPEPTQAHAMPSFPQTPFSGSRASITSIVVTTNASATQLSSSKIYIRPMNTEQVSRYMKKGDVPRTDPKFILGPVDVYLPHSYSKAGDWVPVTCPAGALYFYHEEWRAFTDVYMYNADLRAEINELAKQLNRTFWDLKHRSPSVEYDLVLDRTKTKDGKSFTWSYYYVDHKTRTLFWLDSYDGKYTLLSEARGLTEPGHVKFRLESLYWEHWSLYPTGHTKRSFPYYAFKELFGLLLSSSIGNTSISPSALKTSRLDRYQSIYQGDPRKPTKLIQILSPILFFAPDVHLRELQKVWTDEIIVEVIWKEFMQKLVSEWTELVLYSTVMLATNVAFLAIQGISTGTTASPAQIASSVSLVFSVGSIITGLLLIRRNRTVMTQDPKTACKYLSARENRFVGLEGLAIIFSLTYALLMWSVLVFFIALLLFCFKHTSTEIRVLVGVAAGFVSSLIIWCIANSWDSGDQEDEDPIDTQPETEENQPA
ncbi:hypothetical protein B0F90DRAFT_1814217 [Multifurca ochricompacta]|uniref:Transmembrane protein n=1 Tax=Multifurca ochricompacta TaxID=376703 RepID=A0AAD4MBU7_9AGAM|nr:hypothetical protein B0F90DRAFT_1814217 [Multifurca ochricompacta]